MNVKALGIFLGARRVGVLFQYGEDPAGENPGAGIITRFVADESYIRDPAPPTLSAGLLADTPEEQALFWHDVQSENFNGWFSEKNGWLLPPFFQNLLPEGIFRDHVAALRGCSPKDNFEMLAACGRDLPGNVHALPLTLSRDELAHYVTQTQDALEMSVTADPLEEGVSLSGVQPKVGVILENGRYVGRTKDQDTHIIAKLPVVDRPRLPELEHLSLALARAAGVDTCEAYLEPLEKLAVQHGYDLGDADTRTPFLAVVRYDRPPQGRVHCEDFAQVFGEMPEDKYGGRRRAGEPWTYLDIAAVLLGFPSLGEAAVHELLRRLVVNEMLGNPDMHLKNIGLLYRDGRAPELPPAYDIVAYAAFGGAVGHALYLMPPAMLPGLRREATGRRQQMLSPALLRAFCAALGIPEKPASKVIADCVRAAHAHWRGMIQESGVTDKQKARLIAHFDAHPLVASLARRRGAPASARAES
ncbi:type II toxin-antitoxin system HipA family toxin [Bordetella genomosp. 9]|uniref:Phosphatidylinositol kinase n=1 Tax=Bordetella genomosp. 9 TaxID=1416803 RepID=A0A1W6Z0F2_9BORD|nr:type II toxin-antitoxin system HipA family toxin [Bordetella genomosp. 9]ARP86820.1 phosphatidylinositol kinase [Bordetella genomosp. 9]